MNQRALIIGALTSLLLVFFLFHDLMGSLDKPWGQDPDLYFSYFITQNNLDKLSKLDFHDLFETRMFYPQKKTLTFGGAMFSQTLFALPIYIATKDLFAERDVERLFVSVHIALFLISFLSYLSMYMLAYHFTKNIPGSLLAGLVYTYNPWISTQFPGYPDMLALFLLPLIFLTTEKIIEKITWVRIFALALLFLLQLIFFFYYFLFIVVIWPIYFFCRIKMLHIGIRKFLTPTTIAGILLLVSLVYLYMQPYANTHKKYRFSRPLAYVINQSAKPSDFFFTNPANILYGKLVSNPFVQRLRPPFSNFNNYEHSLFMGLTVYVLLALAIILLIKKGFKPADEPVVKIFFLIFVVSLVLSFGPYLSVGSLNIPFPYLLLYKMVPFVDTLRVPARFMVMMYLSVGILIAFVLAYSPKLKIYILLLIFATVIGEYQHSLPTPFQIEPEKQQFYTWLDRQSDVNVILELPMANDLIDYPTFSRDYIAETTYLFYALYHTKHLVNGTSSFIPQETINLGKEVTIHFPTREKLDRLKRMGVDLLIVHLDEYPNINSGKEVVEKLKRTGIFDRYQLGNIYAFEI